MHAEEGKRRLVFPSKLLSGSHRNHRLEACGGAGCSVPFLQAARNTSWPSSEAQHPVRRGTERKRREKAAHTERPFTL